MTFIQLLYFIKTAETGSMRLAAQQLFVSQPSLSQAIHQLEDDLGYKLFNRTSSGVTLTSEGDEALEIASQIISLITQLEHLKPELKNDETMTSSPKSFKIFCTSHQNGFLLSDILSIVKKYNPNTLFSINEFFIQTIFEAVSENACDLGIFVTNKETLSGLQSSYPELEIRIFQKKQAYILINHQSPLSNNNFVTLNMLKNYPMVLLNQDLSNGSSSEKIYHILFGTTISNNIVFKSSNHLLIEDYISNNKDCFTVFFPALHKPALHKPPIKKNSSLKKIPIQDGFGYFGIAFLKNSPYQKIINQFFDLLKNFFD